MLPGLTSPAAADVKEELTKSMADFGFMIIQTLVTGRPQGWRCMPALPVVAVVLRGPACADIEPDLKVRAAMNEINAAQRLR